MMGLHGAWTKVEESRYATKEEAHEAMKRLGEKLCSEIEKSYITKLKQYNYKMIEPEHAGCESPIVYKGVQISENAFTFESSPVGYIQVFEA